MTNKTNRNFGPPYLKYQLNANTFDSPRLDADLGSQSRTSAIIDGLGMDRRCTDRSVLRERLESRRLFRFFGSLSRCFSVLSAWLAIHLEQACCAALVNPNMKRIVT